MGTAIAGRAARFVYGCHAWASLLLISASLACALAVTPGVDRRRRLARAAARLFFFVIGSPVRVDGAVPPSQACVVVANHSSYLDGVVLTAALPPRFTFLIKREMTAVPLAGFILKRLGSKFVDRGDARHRKVTARDLVASAANGDALALFPEGTFDRAPGLKPFQTGAFAAAWRATLPVVPAVVLGARHKLPSGAFLPAPGPLRVRLCEPLDSAGYRSSRELMRATRAAMLAHLGEPDLDTADAGGRADDGTAAEDDAPVRAETPAASTAEPDFPGRGASAPAACHIPE
ncbi:MAG TPA: lysophospholipid acyltransferase family protein [Gammaproteobacteria bacterium]